MIWERQPGESSKAHDAFRRYLLLGPHRSIVQAASEVGSSGSARTRQRQWEIWSARNQWVLRVSAYDDHVVAQEFRVLERERLKLAQRRARLEMTLQDRVERRVEHIDAKLDKLEEMPNTDIEQIKYDSDGNIISRQKVKGVRPGEYAKVIDTFINLTAVAVHGHIKVSRSERIETEREEGKRAGSFGATTAMHLVLDEWPVEDADNQDIPQ